MFLWLCRRLRPRAVGEVRRRPRTVRTPRRGRSHPGTCGVVWVPLPLGTTVISIQTNLTSPLQNTQLQPCCIFHCDGARTNYPICMFMLWFQVYDVPARARCSHPVDVVCHRRHVAPDPGLHIKVQEGSLFDPNPPSLSAKAPPAKHPHPPPRAVWFPEHPAIF